MLRKHNVECEYADAEHIVCMFTTENSDEDYERTIHAFGENREIYGKQTELQISNCIRAISIREAMFAQQETISVKDAMGRICGTPAVSCPPAIPIVVAGEVIDEDAMNIFDYYGIKSVDVLKE